MKRFQNFITALSVVTFLTGTLALPFSWAKKPIRVKDCTFDELIKYLADGGSTTSLRKESKWVVRKEEQEAFLKEIQNDYGSKMKLRDVPLEGTRNVTTTDYAVQITIPGAKKGDPVRHAKLRVRSYGSRPEGTRDPIKLAEAFEDRAKVELKIDHPTLEDVVYKPGITMKRKDIEVLLAGPESYKQNVTRLREATKKLPENKGQEELVDKMFNTVGSLYEERAANLGKNVKDAPKKMYDNANIQYERDAYRIDMMDVRKNPPKKIDIQITIDRNIEFRNPKNQYEVLASYPEDYRAIEIKVPVEYEKMSPEELKEAVPELYALKQKYGMLKQVSEVPAGKGKSGTLGQMLAEQKTWKEKIAAKMGRSPVGRFIIDRALKTYTSHLLVYIPIGAIWYFSSDRSAAETASSWAKIAPVYTQAEKDLNALADKVAITGESAMTSKNALLQMGTIGAKINQAASSVNITERKEYLNFVQGLRGAQQQRFYQRQGMYFQAYTSYMQSQSKNDGYLGSPEFLGLQRGYVREAIRMWVMDNLLGNQQIVDLDKDLATIQDRSIVRREVEDAIREGAGVIDDIRRAVANP